MCPANTSATVVLPEGVTMADVFENGKPLQGVYGVLNISVSPIEEVQLKLGSGHYEFEMKRRSD